MRERGRDAETAISVSSSLSIHLACEISELLEVLFSDHIFLSKSLNTLPSLFVKYFKWLIFFLCFTCYYRIRIRIKVWNGHSISVGFMKQSFH